MYPVNTQFNSQYLTPEQVGERLGVKTSTVYAWISRGEIRAFKFERRRYISEEQINDFQHNRGSSDYIDYRYANSPNR